jgi:hypothetical protein
LNGELVHPSGRPEHGDETYDEALAGGRAFKDLCKKAAEVLSCRRCPAGNLRARTFMRG